MTDHRAIQLSHEGQLQGAIFPQSVDDERLGAAADRMPGEGEAHQFPDHVGVGGLLWAGVDHSARLTAIAPAWPAA
jgi:hypothetical protein